MQMTSATWKALAARLSASDYIHGNQALSIYSGSTKAYENDGAQRIRLFSGGQEIFDSDVRRTLRVYSGNTAIYENGHLTEYADSVYLEAAAEIDGTTYTDLPAAPVVNRALMQDGLSVGNAVSASCALSIRTGNSIPRAAEVLLKVRLTDGTITSEWLPMGTFFISRRSLDPVTGVVTLECYDALLKANAPWEPAEGDLPMSMADAAEALAELLGVELDSRSAIATGALYVIDSLSEGETIRDTLSRIAVANGGNWIITPANALRLVPLADAADAAAATDALVVGGVTGGISAQPTSTVTGIRYGGEEGAILGDDTGTVIDIGENAAFLQVLYDRLVGLTFRPFDLAGAVYDPAAELGDYVRAGVNGEVASVLHSEVASYGPGFTGTLSAPQGGELADEYPYIGGAANKALLAARAYARQVTEALDGALTQQEVFDRLTGNGAAQGLFLTQDGQLFINASYIYSGLLTLGGLNNENGTMRVLDASGNVICTLSNTGVDITDGSVATYAADRLLRSILSNGQLSVQYWGQDGGTGRYLWKNMLAITADTDGGEVRASTGALTLRGKDAVHLTNRNGTTDTVYATADMEDADLKLHVWSAPSGVYEGDSTIDMQPESITMTVGDGDPTTDDPTVELSRNGLDASAPRVNVTATDGAASVSATYTDLSGNEHTGTATYDGDTLDVEGALDVSDPARTRTNLGITPANIGALPSSGGTVTGAVARKVSADFDTPPSSTEWTQIIPITDEDDAIRGGVYMVRNTDGSYQAIYGAYKPGVGWNYIAPKINADDSFGYGVNHPEALLSAIGVRWKKVTGTTSSGGVVGLGLAKNRYMVTSVWSLVSSGSSHICTPLVTSGGTNWSALVETVTHSAVANTAVTLYVGYIDFGAGNIS